MKQVKKAYNKCKAKIPNRSPDEIDFGLGFRAALEWIAFYGTGPEVDKLIKKELK